MLACYRRHVGFTESVQYLPKATSLLQLSSVNKTLIMLQFSTAGIVVKANLIHEKQTFERYFQNEHYLFVLTENVTLEFDNTNMLYIGLFYVCGWVCLCICTCMSIRMCPCVSAAGGCMQRGDMELAPAEHILYCVICGLDLVLHVSHVRITPRQVLV